MPKQNKYNFLIKQFKKIWREKQGTDELENLLIEKLIKSHPLIEIPKDKRKIFMNSLKVYGIIPKKEEIRKLILSNFDVFEEKVKLKNMEARLNKKSGGKAQFNIPFLNLGMNLIKFYEKVDIKLTKDSPIWMEVEDFIFLLAPRKETE